ncbi:AAA family ATPase [Heliobacillus mobilis]|uniref:AAA family ATPase n=1 Tax=Heliobacterium mobile TaxID=28064 RepID=A0A6I3SM67_HELMO|nr:AAA family ATPase [Heliobacterium mobile]MTV50061.1 AAA family ATPase [Heliobacterium mobile]
MLTENQGQYIRSIRLRQSEVPTFSEYPFSLPAVKRLNEVNLHSKVTFFVGENGTGKSTLLEAIAIAVGFNPEGGTINFNFSTRDSHSELHRYLTIVRNHKKPKDGFFLRAESFYNLSTNIDELNVISSYGGRSLHKQSHGEAFFATFMNRFSGCGIYILDEPEAALSPTRQMAMVSRIHDLVQQNSQFIIATHSPIIMAYPDALIFHFSESGIEVVEYEQTEHYRVTREFLMNRKKMLDILME